MKFSLFYGQSTPKPWAPDTEYQVFQSSVAQTVLADELGYHCIWASEHHFLEEYAHGSAPELFLATVAARTQRIRVGHGIVLMPPKYNHPARVAERIGTLDLLSGGRVEFGTGESASVLELEGFGIKLEDKGEMWREATEQCLDMLTMTPYPGFEGRFFSMPCRNVVPKPLQKPHPPVWLACSSSETIKKAARNGIGALVFSFVSPAEAKFWVDEYYRTFREECVPIGHSVNPNIAVFTGFGVHRDEDEAMKRWIDPFRFNGFGLAHHYVFGRHRPGRTDIAADFRRARDTGSLKTMPDTTAIGSPDKVRAGIRSFVDIGIDQLGLIMTRAPQDHCVESLELFATEIMAEYRDEAAEREARKAAELAPSIERAFERKARKSELADEDVPEVVAIGRKIAQESAQPLDLATVFPKARLDAIAAPIHDPLNRG